MTFINEYYQNFSDHKFLILYKLYWVNKTKDKFPSLPFRYDYNIDTETARGGITRIAADIH